MGLKQKTYLNVSIYLTNSGQCQQCLFLVQLLSVGTFPTIYNGHTKNDIKWWSMMPSQNVQGISRQKPGGNLPKSVMPRSPAQTRIRPVGSVILGAKQVSSRCSTCEKICQFLLQSAHWQRITYISRNNILQLPAIYDYDYCDTDSGLNPTPRTWLAKPKYLPLQCNDFPTKSRPYAPSYRNLSIRVDICVEKQQKRTLRSHRHRVCARAQVALFENRTLRVSVKLGKRKLVRPAHHCTAQSSPVSVPTRVHL